MFIRNIMFNHFLNKVAKTKKYNLIINYIKDHEQLSKQQQENLTELMCKCNDAKYLYEFVRGGSIDSYFLNEIGRALIATECPYYIDKFIRKFPNLSVNEELINVLCELKDFENLYIYLNSDDITDVFKRKIITAIIRFGAMRNIEVLVRCFYDLLSLGDRKCIINRTCNSLNGKYIIIMSSLLAEDGKDSFVDAICKTDDAEMMYNFVVQNNDLSKPQIKKIIKAIYDTDDMEYIYKSLFILNDNYSHLRKMLLEKINASDDIRYMLLTTVYYSKEYLMNNFNFVRDLYERVSISNDICSVQELDAIDEYMQKVKNESKQLKKIKENS